MATLTVGDVITLTGAVNADITGATLAVHIRRPDGSVINRPGTIEDATGGGWSFDLVDGDLSLRGTYKIEVHVDYSGGGDQTFGTDRSGKEITFLVRNDYID